MSINKRVRAVREAKEMSMNAFAKAIGLSQSGISAIEYETRNVTEKNIRLICITFGVNEDWLRTGEGEMFVQTDQSIIEALAKKYALDDLDFSIIECFMKLPPTARAAMKSYLRSLSDECAKHDVIDANALLRQHADNAENESENAQNDSEARA